MKQAIAAAILSGALIANNGACAADDATEAAVRSVLEKNPEIVHAIVKDYLLKNPDVVQQMLVEMIKRRQVASVPARDTDKSAPIAANADVLLRSPRQVTLGNPDGDVTIVEFFDYNCGFCKRAAGDIDALIASDSKLRVVLKEFPVLGSGSVEAAQVGAALRMQDPSGKRYYDFHKRLMAASRSDKSVALAAAKSAGADMTRLERDLLSPEISATLDENSKLARALGISGTPNYVIGNKIVTGARGADALRSVIREVRG